MMVWLGAIALIALLTAAQELFYETHRRRYGLWRSTLARRFWASSGERRLMFTAVTHRDPDARVELSRLLFIGVIVVSLVGLVLLGSAGRLGR